MPTKKLLFIDFDHTIIDDNSDFVIKSLAGTDGIPNEIEELCKDPNNWTFYMRDIFEYLHQKNVSMEDYSICLAKAPLVDGIKELLSTIHGNGDCEIIILSDSNSFFIDCILQHNGLTKIIERIFTNPAKFNVDGCLQIQKYQEKGNCMICPDNLCKGDIVQSYVSQKLSFGYDCTVLYVGDGSNDLCPALKLTSKDFVFAREGYRLLKKLKKIPVEKVKPTVVPWKSGYDILKFLE